MYKSVIETINRHRYQYNSINRGEHSIMQQISNAGFDPLDYIRFFNLRNYDRVIASSQLQ